MKRLFSLILALFCLCLAVPVSLAADGSAFELPELNMTIDIPEGWYASAQDVQKGDPNLDIMEMSENELADFYKENGIYLNMISPDRNVTILVKMDECSDDPLYFDYNYMANESLLKMVSKNLGGENISDGSVYMHKQTRFVVFKNENNIYYQTRINGQGISVVMAPLEGEASGSLEQMLKKIVNSIVFTKVSSEPICPQGPDAASFELPELNMTIDSPAGWFAFTQDIDENDLDFLLLKEEVKGLGDQYKEKGIYLDMISEYPYDRITVMMRKPDRTDIYDYNDLSDDELPEAASNVKEIKERTISDSSVYKHKQAKFARFDFTDKIDGQPVFGKLYITVINGQEIIILLQSESQIPDILSKTIQDTVDSITFTKVTPKPPASKAFELPELNMKIDSPEGWYVFTRDVKEDAPGLEYLGIDGKGLADEYKESGTYLDMISAAPGAEIYVAMIDSKEGRDIYDFNYISAEDLLPAISKIQEVQKQAEKQIEFSDAAVYAHKQAKFVYYDYTWQTDGITVHGIQYCTVINGQIIIISMSSREGDITGSLAQTLKSIVDSITFTEVKSKLTGDYTAVLAIIAGAAAGAVIGAAIFALRKRRYKNKQI